MASSREQPPAGSAQGRLDDVPRESAARFGSRIALVDGSARWTYAELDCSVDRAAALLHQHGVRPGDTVGLDCRNNAEFVICYYAISRVGGIVVPLNVLIGASLLADRLADCAAVLLVCVVGPDDVPAERTARAAVDRVPTCRGAIVIDSAHSLSDLAADSFDQAPAPSRGAAEAAVITYPRRDPGAALGVVLSHAAMISNAAAVAAALPGGPGPDVHLVGLPLFHVVAQAFQLNPGLAAGATIVLLPRFEPVAALRTMATERVTTLVATPSMLWALAGAAERDAALAETIRAGLRLVSSQLAPLPPAVARAFTERLGVLPLEGFGHSETGMVALHARPGDDRPQSVGTPMPGVDARIVDPAGLLVPDSGTGELWVRGAGLMTGYLHRPDETQAAMRDGWYRTGTMARREPDGHFVLVDRPTHVVIRGGFVIYRRAVEEALLTHPAISEVKAVAMPHPGHGEELRTVIERDPRAVVSEAELLEWAREQLPGLAGTELAVAGGREDQERPRTARVVLRRLLPGLALVIAATLVAFVANLLVPFLSPLTAGVLLGVIVANTGLVPAVARPGLASSTRRLLRAGVVLLGLQLSLPELVGLGAPLLAAVVATVLLGFLATHWLGQRLGLPPGLSLLTATGFAICGASAIAAMEGPSGGDEDEVATSIALVTIFGSIAMFCWPLLRHPLNLSDEAYGAWSGMSVHEVAQVVAAASPAGGAALATAVVVKLARVVMLAPLVAVVAVIARRRHKAQPEPGGRRPPLVPLFVVGFLAMVLVRGVGIVPASALEAAKVLTTALLTAALFGLGTGVRLRVLLATGPRALALGAASTVLIAAVAYAGVLITVSPG